MKEWIAASRKLLQFIDKSPSPFHAIAQLKNELNAAGWTEYKETQEWKPGEDFYVCRNSSSLIGLRFPQAGSVKGFRIIAAHSDSPSFKIKEKPEIKVENEYIKLNVEKYGGMILSTWMDRCLSAAGRVMVRTKEGIEERLLAIDKDLFVIPNVAIHMNREMNKGVEYNPQVDMLPLFGQTGETKGSSPFMKLLSKKLGASEEDILAYDLYLYVRETGKLIGNKQEFIFAPRLDDLQSVFAAKEAFLEAASEEYATVLAVFDNEEVGSGTKQGADSTFLEDVLWRVCEGMGMTRGQYLQCLAESFLLSADNAHAVHPNHPEKADPTNRPYLNQGLVMKYHGGQKYTTDAASGAFVKLLAREAKLPLQIYFNRSDIVGGSTLGNISTAHVSIHSADVGFPQLAMHSAVETAGAKDTLTGIQLFKRFYQG